MPLLFQMIFRAPSRCPRVRRRSPTSAYPSSSPRPSSSSPSVSLPRDRPTVSAPPIHLPPFPHPGPVASSQVPHHSSKQEDSSSSHLRRKLISSINSRDHRIVVSAPLSSSPPLISHVPHSSTSSGEIYANPKRIPTPFLPPSPPLLPRLKRRRPPPPVEWNFLLFPPREELL